jgi:hypothetical protein
LGIWVIRTMISTYDLSLRNESELNPDSFVNIKKVSFIQCKIPVLDLRPYTQLISLTITHNTKKTLVYFPPNLEKLIVSNHSKLIYMNPIPINVHTIMIWNSLLNANISHLVNLKYLHYDKINMSVPTLPSGLLELYCQFNPALKELPALPPSLEKLNCTGCNLNSLPPLPDGLQELCCDGNSDLVRLPQLPPALNILRARNCQLMSLPLLPDKMQHIDVSNNHLTEFHSCRIPLTLTHLNICYNPVQYYPYIYRNNILVKYDCNKLWNAFVFTSFTLNDVKVYTPLHLLEGLEPTAENDDSYFMDLTADDVKKNKIIRRLQVMCEIQNQVLCRTFLRTIKEELIMRTWHPSRVIAWCGVDFTSDDD